MATREAGIKVTLDQSAFLAGLDGIGRKAKAVGGQIKTGLQAGFKGVGGDMMKGGKDAFKDMAGGLKQMVGTAATLGGGIGFGMLVKKASDLREKVRDIEFQINKTGGATVAWQDILKDVQGAAEATGKSSDEMANIYEGLFASTGDADFAKNALVPIGHAATASGKSLDGLANAAQVLQRKFGATAETLPEMLAVFLQKTDAGGPALDALGGKFALMAGEAQEAGFRGKEGLAQLLGTMIALDSRVGEKSEPAMKKLFQLFKDGSKDLQALSKESGIKFDPDMTGVEKFRKMLGSDKGRSALQEKLGGEARVVYDELAKPFEVAFEKAKSTGAKTKEATEAGLAAWDESMQKAGKVNLDYAKLIQESKAGQLEDPMAKLNKAIEKIGQKFTEPQMLEALDNLSESLPKVADGAIKLLDFATNHPALAGAAFVGAKVGGGMAMAGLSTLGSNVAGMLKNALFEGGKSLGADIKSTMTGGAPAWGKAMGSALGIAGAAVIAVEIGKALIDARIAEKERSQKESQGIDIEAANAKNRGDKQGMIEAKAKLEADLARQKSDYNSFTKSGLDPMMNLLAGMVDKDFKAPELTQMGNTQKAIDELNTALSGLTEKVNAATKGSEDLATGTKKAGQAAQQASQQLVGISGTQPPDTTGGGTSKGPGGLQRATPGYAAGG